MYSELRTLMQISNLGERREKVDDFIKSVKKIDIIYLYLYFVE